jgi:hypothetical protein
MSWGNNMLPYLCRMILDYAIDYPSRYFVMTSRYTSLAMKEAMEHFTGIQNIYLSIDEFVGIFKRRGNQCR